MPQCDGKKKYGTATLAQIVASRPRRGHNRPAIRVYQCRLCNCFHLTSQPLRWWAQ